MKEKPSFVSLVLALAVIVLAVIEAKFAWSFWGSLAGEDSAHATDYRMMGVTIAIVELILLTVATNGARRGYTWIAYAARMVFIPVVIVNFLVGASAIATFLANDVQQRATDVARYEYAALSAKENKERAVSLHGSLARSDLDLPPQALEGKVSGIEGLIRESGQTPWRVQRLAELEAALATAEEIKRLEQEEKELNSIRLSAARPEEVSPYMQWLVTVVSWMGITLEPAQIRDGLTMLLAVTLRALLSCGWWIALAPYSGQRDRGNVRSVSDPAKGDFRKRAIAMWRWPKSWTAPPKAVPVTSGFIPGDDGGGRSGPMAPPQASPPPIQSTSPEREKAEGAETKPRPPRRTSRKPPAPKSRRDENDDPLDDIDPVE